jgi:hypothetical protein
MQPADQFTPEQLVGRRVAFAQDEEHAGCWHRRVGLQGGVVLRRALSPEQKAQLVGGELALDPEWFAGEEEVVRLWVKADPCDALRNGCETAVELGCLLVP